MSIALQNIYSNKHRPTSSHSLLFHTHSLKAPILPFSAPVPRPHLGFCRYSESKSVTATTVLPITRIKSFIHKSHGTSQAQVNGNSTSTNSVLNGFKFDDFLSVLEILALASSAAVSAYVALSGTVQKGGIWGSRIFKWQWAILVCCAVIGAVIRQRQWRRIFGHVVSGRIHSHGADLVGRVEKLETDLRSSAAIVRVLSRQIEKISIRVRATRKNLKNPIAETASLAQRNSESIRAFAAQQEVLENEIAETQKILLAMQEQQQKQIDLILGIAKAGKLLETRRAPVQDQKAAESSKSTADVKPVLESEDDEIPILQEQTSNNRA